VQASGSALAVAFSFFDVLPPQLLDHLHRIVSHGPNIVEGTKADRRIHSFFKTYSLDLAAA
jgi:hypothetical protein